MKLKYAMLLCITSLCFITIQSIMPSPVDAQDGEKQIAQTEDGHLEFEYPGDWLDTNDSINSVIIADSETSLAAFENGGAINGIAIAVTTLEKLETETETPLDFEAIDADEFLEEYQNLFSTFAVADTVFITFDFGEYQQLIYAVDFEQQVYLFFAYTDDGKQAEAQVNAIVDTIRFIPAPSPIPDDRIPIDDVVPQSGEYNGLVYETGCLNGGSRTGTIYLEIAELSLLDNQLQMGIENPLRYTRIDTGVYTNDETTVVWKVISDSSFIREIITDQNCTNTIQYFTKSNIPTEVELAEDSPFTLPLSTTRYERIGVSDCEPSEVSHTLTYLDYQLVEGNRLRTLEHEAPEGILIEPSLNIITYYEPTGDTAVYQHESHRNVSVIHLASPNFFTVEQQHSDGCTVWYSYLVDEILDHAGADIIEFDPAVINPTTETGLNTQLFFDAHLIVAYPDLFNDSYLPPNDLSFTISADGNNGELEIFMAAAEEVANNFSGDIASMSLEEFANGDRNADVYGTLLTSPETVDGVLYPTLTSTYQQGERRLTFYFMDIEGVGKLFIKVTTPLEDWAASEAIVLEVINSINNPNVVSVPTAPDYEITTDSGQTFTPDNSNFDLKINALGNTPMLEIRGDNGYLVTIRFDGGLESGTYEVMGTDPRLVNATPFGMLNIPTDVTTAGGNTPLAAIYGSQSRGTITIENDGTTLSATFEISSTFSQFMTFGEQPIRPNTLPEMVSFSGSFSHIPLASLEE